MRRLEIKKSAKILALISVVSFMLSGCGDDNWGIDNCSALETAQDIELSHGPFDPNTKKYRCNIEDATLIKSGGVVKPMTDDTQIRIWHYQNSEEYVCLLQGKAVVKQPVETKGK